MSVYNKTMKIEFQENIPKFGREAHLPVALVISDDLDDLPLYSGSFIPDVFSQKIREAHIHGKNVSAEVLELIVFDLLTKQKEDVKGSDGDWPPFEGRIQEWLLDKSCVELTFVFEDDSHFHQSVVFEDETCRRALERQTSLQGEDLLVFLEKDSVLHIPAKPKFR